MIKLTVLSEPTHKVYGDKEEGPMLIYWPRQNSAAKSQDWECADRVSTYLLFFDLYDLGPVILPVWATFF